MDAAEDNYFFYAFLTKLTIPGHKLLSYTFNIRHIFPVKRILQMIKERSFLLHKKIPAAYATGTPQTLQSVIIHF